MADEQTEKTEQKKPRPKRKWYVRWGRRLLMTLVVLFLLYVLAGFLVLPLVARSVLEKQLSRELQRTVTVGDVSLNPLTLRASVARVRVARKEGDEAFVEFEEFTADLAWRSVLELAPILENVRLVAPHVWIVRNADGTLNFSDLIQEDGEPGEEEPREGKTFKFRVADVRVLDGKVDYIDRVAGREHKVRDLTFSLPLISTFPGERESYIQPDLTTKINEADLSVTAKAKPFGKTTEVELDLAMQTLKLPFYMVHVPGKARFKLVSGKVDTDLHLTLRRGTGVVPLLQLHGTVAIADLEVVGPEGEPILKLPALNIDVAPSPVLQQRLNVKSVLIDRPEAHLELNRRGELTLLGLFEPPEPNRTPKGRPTAAQKPAKPEVPFVVNLAELKLADGKLSFVDRSRGKPFQKRIQNLRVLVRDLSTESGSNGRFEITLRTDRQEQIQTAGTLGLDPMKVRASTTVKAVDLPAYAAYYPEMLQFQIEGGRLTVKTEAEMSLAGKKPAVRLQDLGLALTDLRLLPKGAQEPVLVLPRFAVSDSSFDLQSRRIELKQVKTQDAEIALVREKDGRINLAQLIASSPAPEADAPAPKQDQPAAPKKAEPQPWVVSLGDLQVRNYAVDFTDLSPTQPVKVRVHQIELNLAKWALPGEEPGRLALRLRIGENAKLAIRDGRVGLDPPTASMNVTLEALPLNTFESYLTEYVAVALAEGRLRTNGKFELKPTGTGNPTVSYAGDVAVSGLLVKGRRAQEKLLGLEELAVRQMNFSTQPLGLVAKAVELTGLSTRVILNESGRLNVGRAEAEPEGLLNVEEKPDGDEKATVTAGPEPQPFRYAVESVSLAGSDVSFEDRTISPAFQAQLAELTVRGKQISSQSKEPWNISLKTLVNKHAPLDAKVQVRPTVAEFLLALELQLRGLDLTSLTPYSERYIGYRLRRGKLSYDVDMKIQGNQLNSKNQVLLDQLALGEKVESPVAVDKPIPLALSLLRNRKGEIQLDLPVSGDITDPAFSYRKALLGTFGNVVGRIVSAPFAVLGKLVPGIGGEELRHIEFEAGSSELNETGRKKLDALVKVLEERPDLKLEIEGYVDLKQDRRHLRDRLFMRRLKQQKARAQTTGEVPLDPDKIELKPDEFDRWLLHAFRAETWSRHLRAGHRGERIPVSQIEYLMRNRLPVTRENLRELATQRARLLRNKIVESKKIAPERIFIVVPDDLTPKEKEEKVSERRVTFRIR